MLTAEYGGSGGKPIESGMVVEEPDIEIGAGVSSKGKLIPLYHMQIYTLGGRLMMLHSNQQTDGYRPGWQDWASVFARRARSGLTLPSI